MPSKHIELDYQYSVQCFPKRQDIVITGSNGSKLIDDSGNEYLDLFMETDSSYQLMLNIKNYVFD